jgi:HK97 family phage portal protein
MAWYSTILFGFGVAGRRQAGLQQANAGSYQVPSNVTVNEDTALKLSAVWACVRLIAETVAGLPLNCFKVNDDGSRVPYPEHPLAILFKNKPNRYQNRVEFFETMVMQLAIHGNAYALISKRGGRVVSLMPLMAEQMEVALLTDGTVTYRYNNGNSDIAVYAEESIWHIKLMSNGIVGLSPLSYARNSIGIGLAGDDRVSALARNGFKPTGILTIDKLLKPEQREAIRKQFADLAEGSGDPLRVLEAGMNYQQISMNPKDVQLLETRRFQIEDIARFFGVPSVLINDTSASTTWGSGIEQIVQGFYKLGLRPYLERIETSIQNSLLQAGDRNQYEFEFDFGALLRGDEKTRYATYKEAVLNGLKTVNECRAQEGLAPIDGGEVAYMQGQMTPLTTLSNPPEPVDNTAPVLGAMADMARDLKSEIYEIKNKEPLHIDLNPNIKVESSPISLTLKSELENKATRKSIKLVRDENGNVTGAQSSEE